MKKRTLPRLALTRITMRPLDAEPRVLAAIRCASRRSPPMARSYRGRPRGAGYSSAIQWARADSIFLPSDGGNALST
jgi:hypothetical protein